MEVETSREGAIKGALKELEGRTISTQDCERLGGAQRGGRILRAGGPCRGGGCMRGRNCILSPGLEESSWLWRRWACRSGDRSEGSLVCNAPLPEVGSEGI